MTQTSSTRVSGRVVGVLTERELIINVGENAGVKPGMKFKVLTDKPTEVIDPESSEVLGYIDREKVRVKAEESNEKFSVCKTYETVVVGGGALADAAIGWSALLTPRKEIPETLKVEDATFLPPISEEDSCVKRGDRVVEIDEDDEQSCIPR